MEKFEAKSLMKDLIIVVALAARVYPGFALLLGIGISRHYGSIIIVDRMPELYIGSAYLLAHLHESLFPSLSNPSLSSGSSSFSNVKPHVATDLFRDGKATPIDRK